MFSNPAHARTLGRRRWLTALFVLAIALLVVSGQLVYRQHRESEAATRRVEHTLHVLRQALALDAEILQMEADHRGWLVREDPAFVASRDRRHEVATAQLTELRRLTADNRRQQERIASIAGTLSMRYERMRTTGALAESGGIDAARAYFRGSGDGSLQPLRASIAAVLAEEQALLHERAEAASTGAARLGWAIIVVPFAALVVLVLAFRALLTSLASSERLRDELARAEAIQRSMLDGAGYMIIATDDTGIVRLFNRAASRTLGWDADEVVGRDSLLRFQDSTEDGDREAAASVAPGRPVGGFEALVAALRDGDTDESERTWVTRDGRRFPVQQVLAPVRERDGSHQGYVVMAQDISERKAAERDIRDLNLALEGTVQELEGFSYSVSHDLRAPLRHIDGYAGMLAEELGDALSGEGRRLLDAVGSASRRMGALIDALLGLARLGRKPLEKQAVDMDALARDAWTELTREEPGSALVVPAALPGCAGDPALLRQVWLNLLSNAIKYSRPRGRDACVEVFSTRDDDRIAYHVRDNGVGFDARYADKLFGVFQRLHAQDQFEGTGVGLAIVSRIVARHGGRVMATSTIGSGATFSFELPAGDQG